MFNPTLLSGRGCLPLEKRIAGNRRMFLPIFVLVLMPTTLHADEEQSSADQTAWKYVSSTSEAAFNHPPLKALSLQSQKPQDMNETVAYGGERQLYTQIRYGTANSIRVIVVIDELPDGKFDLYVDLNRNRTIEEKERIPGEKRTRRTKLPTEINRDDIAERLPRSVIFRRGLLAKTLGFATCGYLEGAVEIDGQTIRVRRVDGDGNGFFADTRDRIWLDRNGDGQWDAFTEQFPCRPILRVDGNRYALRSDSHGFTLKVRKLSGSGSIQLLLKTLSEQAKIEEMEVMLIGEDGSAVAIRQNDRAVQVPIGRYAFGTVRLTIPDPQSNLPWTYVFSRSGTPAEKHWFKVKKNQKVTVDPVGKLQFVLKGGDLSSAAVAGKTVSVKPRLYTEDGLLLNNCGQGNSDSLSREGHCAEVRLVDSSSQLLTSVESGFA